MSVKCDKLIFDRLFSLTKYQIRHATRKHSLVECSLPKETNPMSVHPKVSMDFLAEETDSDGSGTTLYLDDRSSKKKKNQLSSILKKHHQQLNTEFEKKQLPPGVLRLAVFIKKLRKDSDDDDNSFEFELKDGRRTTANEIKCLVLKELEIPPSSAHLFALWLISPHLELQLKYYHRPFYLAKQWKDLLDQYSNCTKEEQYADEPVLVLQRNTFIPVEEEKQETNENVLKRLYEEASYNIIHAHYPVLKCDAEMLGGIMLRLHEGPFDPRKHKPGYLRKRLTDYLPYYAIGTNKLSQYLHATKEERRLLERYEQLSNFLATDYDCYKRYLDYCHSLDYYGCAFFRGTCYQKVSDYKIWKNDQLPITLGVNRYGITLFQGENNEKCLTRLLYGEFSYDCKRNVEIDDEGTRVDLFLIEYDDEVEGSDAKKVRQIEIDTHLAPLIEGMVESCIKFKNIVPNLASSHKINRKNIRRISFAK